MKKILISLILLIMSQCMPMLLADENACRQMCEQRGSCSWDSAWGKCKPTSPFGEETNQCKYWHGNKNLCQRDRSCTWNDANKSCNESEEQSHRRKWDEERCRIYAC